MSNEDGEKAGGATDPKRKRQDSDDGSTRAAKKRRVSNAQRTLSSHFSARQEPPKASAAEKFSPLELSSQLLTPVTDSSVGTTVAEQIIQALIDAECLLSVDKDRSISTLEDSGLLPCDVNLSDTSVTTPDTSLSFGSEPTQSLTPTLHTPSGSTVTQISSELGMSSKGRHRTQMGPQGEHVSAYVLYEELLFSALDGATVSDAKDKLQDRLKCLHLSDKAESRLLVVYGKLSEQMKKNISKSSLSTLTAAMRAAQFLSDDKQGTLARAFEQVAGRPDVPNMKKAVGTMKNNTVSTGEVKAAVKHANRRQLADLVAKAADVFLQGANKMPHVCFPVEGNRENPHTGEEKTAKNALKRLSEFIELIDDLSQITDDFEQTQRRQDIEKNTVHSKRLSVDWTIDVKSILAKPKDERIKAIESSLPVKHIAEKITSLFWYPRIDERNLYSKETWQVFLKNNPKKYNRGTQPRTNDVTILYRVVGRHLVLVFNCFPGLQKLSRGFSENARKCFLENLLKEQDWDQQRVGSDVLGLREFERGVRDVASFDSGVPSMKGVRQGTLDDHMKPSIPKVIF